MYFSFFFWLISLSMIISWAIHIAAKALYHSFYGWLILHTHTHSRTHMHIDRYIDITSSLCILSVSGYLGFFPGLAIVNSAAVNIRVHVFFLIIVLSGYMPRYGTPGHVVTLSLVFWTSVLSFIMLTSVCISTYTMREGSLFSTPSPVFVIHGLLMMAILTNVGVKWYYIIILICIYHVMKNLQHFFICLLAIWNILFMFKLGRWSKKYTRFKCLIIPWITILLLKNRWYGVMEIPWISRHVSEFYPLYTTDHKWH